MTVVLFTTAGTSTWICPAGVNTISIECLGGGGAGSTRTTNGGGGGGGGGAYAKINSFTVSPGTSYSYTVGSAGVVGGANGGDSSFNSTTCVAKGGATVAADTATGGSGGAASGSTGDIKKDGGSGWTASGGGGGGGGSGGIDNNGNSATSTTGATAVTAGGAGGDGKASPQGNAPANASAYGGGGGGGYRTSSGTRTGSAGAAGYVRITYAPYSMTDFWGCELWYDASDSSTITLVSSVVSQWNDKSGNARNATQSTAGSRPALSTYRNRQVILFDGSDDYMTTATASYLSRTAFAVGGWSAGASSEYRGLFTMRASGSVKTANGDINMGWHQITAGTGLCTLDTMTSAYFNGVSQTPSVASDFNTGFAVSAPFYVSVEHPTANSGSKTFCIGADTGAAVGSRQWNSWIGEIIVYNRPLTSTERTAIESTLNSKWLATAAAPAYPNSRRGGFGGLIVR